MANRAGIKIALSNVCFEYWIILHFVETDAPYESFEDLRRNSVLNAEVRRALGCDYEKASRSLFDLIKGGIPIARERGARLNQRGRENANPIKNAPHQINPYVEVVDLLDAIDAFV